MTPCSAECYQSVMMSVPADEFSVLGAHPTLAGALTRRGYDAPTAVQAAVLQAEPRDLLVSSQTGSGKTVAFGLLIGRVLLGDSATLGPADKPRALVIAPTRELAVQVQRELEWLFVSTHARVASFTGGTDLRLDARALKRGVDLVVGTPGRLVDLTERGSLDLSGLQVVVLDEADEMLDLGFRESLEMLLQRAPQERRTLLFSATLPTGIRSLAQRYQKNALPLDPRQGAVAPHEDIQHVAHLCKNGERLAALVNVLRLHDGERAIVFCRTRDDVSEMHRQLSIRGFTATAISGERAQAERTRALEALRHGRVRVLVATNVAARGLDLPDVGLVIHADLAENADAMTHRSGRTGRAGKKGVNIFIVEQGQRRRAERLFQEAHLKLRWTAPPSAAVIDAHDRERLHAEINEAAGRPASEGAHDLAARLLAAHEPAAVIAALLDRVKAERPAGETLTDIDLSSPASKTKARPSSDGVVLFQVNLGAKDRALPNWILPLVCRRGSITRREVGAIRVDRDRTFVEISASVAHDFAANVAEIDPRAPHVRITRADGETVPAHRPAPHRAHAKSSHDKPAHEARPPAKTHQISNEERPHAKAPEARPAHEERPHAKPAHEDRSHAKSAHEGRPHAKAHEDRSHAKSAHEDRSHAKSAHEDRSHAKSAHEDRSHAKSAHEDRSHAKSAHEDRSHAKSAHEDRSHAKSAHEDRSHAKSAHEGRPHTKAHGERPQHAKAAHEGRASHYGKGGHEGKSGHYAKGGGYGKPAHGSKPARYGKPAHHGKPRKG